MPPHVSVVMPVHNGGQFLAEAVESILRQTWTDLELIAVNDGSTDRTDCILDGFCVADARVQVLRPGKVGFVDALKLGFNVAQGKYIGRMDADDIALPQRLARQIDFLEANAGISACGTAIEVFSSGPGQRMRWPTTPAQMRPNLLFYSPLCHPAVLLRKADLEQHGLTYRNFGGVADYDLWCQMDRRGLRLANLDEVLLRYRRHPDQISTSDSSAQISGADTVRREQLAHYGVTASPRELEIHSRLARWESFSDREELTEAGAWLSRLADEIGQNGAVSHREFQDVLTEHWYFACATASPLGWSSIALFREYSFGRNRPLQSLRLFGKYLRRCLPGRAATP